MIAVRSRRTAHVLGALVAAWDFAWLIVAAVVLTVGLDLLAGLVPVAGGAS